MSGSAAETTYARLVPDGLLYLALVVVWAFVLIPMWLRKHDEANESRSVDRFSRALSSLSGRRDRRGQKSNGGLFLRARAVVMPGRPQGAQDLQVTVSGASGPDRPAPVADSVPVSSTIGSSVSSVTEPAATGAAARSATAPAGTGPEVRRAPDRSPSVLAARRRRQVLLGLLLVTAVVLAAGLLHKIPVWIVAVPAALVLGFLVSARRQRKRAELIRRRRAQRVSITEAARVAEAGLLRRSARTSRTGRVAGAGSGPVTTVEESAAQGADDTVRRPVDERAWSAVPTTLPTYVTAPAATRVPRVIDRTTPGSWSGAAMLEQARTTRQQESVEESGMRVESFEIRVPASASAGPAPERAASTYAERYVDTTAGSAELDATDDESVLSALLDDPRTGAWPETDARRRAAG